VKITWPILFVAFGWALFSQPKAMAQHPVTVETLKQIVAAFNAQ
jgi:hypothetical protein